jgi:glycosyltransferase involved in cell wall biosynthesis
MIFLSAVDTSFINSGAIHHHQRLSKECLAKIQTIFERLCMSLASYLKNAISSWRLLLFSESPESGIAILRSVWRHHAKHSGYHPVANGLGLVLPSQYVRLVPRRIARIIVGEERDTAYQIALAMQLKRCRHLLVIDGDFQLGLINAIRQITKAKISAVFHQTPVVLKELLASATPSLLDTAICVAKCQIPVVQRLAPAGKTSFVPHGIDTDYFSPGQFRSTFPVVLCVGSHQRDLKTLVKSADVIKRSAPATSVRLIAPRSTIPADIDLGQVVPVFGISDEQLVAEYRRAWVVLLPLSDATANNSLLEGMACGTPVVATNVGGVADYMTADCGALCPPSDAQAHGRAILEMLNNDSRRGAAGCAARARAELFSWPEVQKQMRAILS